jgi:tetratricopeptide (TPR) repeat protein
MRKVGVTGIAVVLATALPLLQCTLPADEVSKVPITTSSDKALELYLQGRDLAEKLRGQEALAFFEKAVAEDPGFAMGYLNLSFVQPTGDGFFEHLNKAKSLSKDVSEGEQLWISGVEAGASGLIAKQREYYQRLVATYPDDERTHNLLGNHYFGQQQYDEAIAEYEKAIAINPEFSQPYNQLGYSHRFMGNYEQAEEVFEKYIDLIPDDPNPYDSYAELLMATGEYQASIENYRKALTKNPQFVPSHIGIATNLNFMEKHQEAREQLREMYEVAVNDGQRRQALLATAISHVDEQHLEKAMEVLHQRYGLAKKNEDTAAMAGDLNTMGTILLEAHEVDKALGKFEKSLKLTMESDQSADIKENAKRTYLFNTARVALAKKDLATAKAQLAEYREKAQVTGNQTQVRLSHQLAGMIALQEKNYQEAIGELEQSNQLNPYNLYRMAQAFDGKGDTAEANELYRRVANLNSLNSLNYAFIRSRAKERAAAT